MMKKYLIAVVAALLAVPAFAQSERHYEYDEYGQVGRKEGWARRFAHNFYDALVGAEYYEVVDEQGNQYDKKPVSKKEQKNVSKTYRYYGPGHTPSFYLGVNMLTTDDPMVMVPGLPQKQGKGFELGFAVGQWGYHMTRNIGVNTAFYITRSRYWIDNGQFLDYTSNRTAGQKVDLFDTYDGYQAKQGYLRYWSLRVPVCLEISSASRRGPFIAVGPEIEYRFADVSKVDLIGQDDRVTVADGINVNPIGLNAVARIGINDFGITARYSFTSLFLDDDPVKTYPFMIGISTSF
jgi:hypothetical protein